MNDRKKGELLPVITKVLSVLLHFILAEQTEWFKKFVRSIRRFIAILSRVVFVSAYCSGRNRNPFKEIPILLLGYPLCLPIGRLNIYAGYSFNSIDATWPDKKERRLAPP